VFTHGSNGEYGHTRHKAVHRTVAQMIRAGELKTREAFFFAYRLDEEKRIAVPQERAHYETKLSRQEWKSKRNVVKNLYGFRSNSFENRSCARNERFIRYV
jgi:hypothetical protein